MKKLGYKYHFNEIDKKLSQKIYNKKGVINIIDIDFNFKKIFDKINNKSNKYLKECFIIANNLMRDKKGYALINGPVSKKNFLKKNFLELLNILQK